MLFFSKIMGGELKIYFCGSIAGGRQDGELYGRLIEYLKTFGTVLTAYVGSNLSETGVIYLLIYIFI